MHSLFFRDQNAIYFEDKRLRGADAEHFRVLLGHWATDGRQVFYKWTSRKTLDPATFVPLNHCFGRDATSVVAQHIQIKDADPNSFEVLDPGLTTTGRPGHSPWQNRGYARDKSNVYWANIRLHRGDPTTFQSLRNGYGMDARDVYFNGHRLKGADAASWRHLGGAFSADFRHTFYFYTPVPHCDPETATALYPLESGWVRDKGSYFKALERSSEAAYVQYLQGTIAHYAELADTITSGRYDEAHFARLRDYAARRITKPSTGDRDLAL